MQEWDIAEHIRSVNYTRLNSPGLPMPELMKVTPMMWPLPVKHLITAGKIIKHRWYYLRRYDFQWYYFMIWSLMIWFHDMIFNDIIKTTPWLSTDITGWFLKKDMPLSILTYLMIYLLIDKSLHFSVLAIIICSLLITYVFGYD